VLTIFPYSQSINRFAWCALVILDLRWRNFVRRSWGLASSR